MVVSNEEGTAHCWINQNAKLSLGYYTEARGIDYAFAPANKMLYVFVISGTVRINDEVLGRRDALGIWNTHAPVHLDCAADTRFLLIEAPINH
jgi:redox-sensitive bicupin YhaK (pirin superfamily)